ncbi:hypothetical protein DENSPDRAFT_360978 [Dentipellis sp. KUC8613]|nr:hypothetical protein DENSPDRAFT_360978 [Dentipellis sp. KUC8613]
MPLFLVLPPEILLYILSFLDLPDLAALARVTDRLAVLTADPLLHRTRLLVVAPSRVAHALFGEGPHGCPLRPTVPDLVHWGILRGLGIERRWRMGLYLSSPHSVKHYENSLRLQRRHASHVLSSLLRHRSRGVAHLQDSRVLPDVESSSPRVSRSLLPVMRKLKWSIRKDSLAKMVRTLPIAQEYVSGNAGSWLEKRGTSLVGECERFRLAICPGVKRIVNFYEKLAADL